MGKTIRARFTKGVIEPLEKVDVAEGKEISVTIIDVPAYPKEDAFERSAGAWKGTLDAEKLIEDIYKDRLVSNRKKPKL